jgi:hypothetical protein
MRILTAREAQLRQSMLGCVAESTTGKARRR